MLIEWRNFICLCAAIFLRKLNHYISTGRSSGNTISINTCKNRLVSCAIIFIDVQPLPFIFNGVIASLPVHVRLTIKFPVMAPRISVPTFLIKFSTPLLNFTIIIDLCGVKFSLMRIIAFLNCSMILPSFSTFIYNFPEFPSLSVSAIAFLMNDMLLDLCFPTVRNYINFIPFPHVCVIAFLNSRIFKSSKTALPVWMLNNRFAFV